MLEELYIAYSLRGTVVIMNVKIAGPKYVS